MIDKEFAIEILKQYREKPTLINEINTVEEAIWLDEALEMGIEALKGHRRKFEEIVVEYPSEDICPYPEYKGKPYFSIKYEEDGKHIQGFGTYKPEVLSRFLEEYFITPAIMKEENEE